MEPILVTPGVTDEQAINDVIDELIVHAYWNVYLVYVTAVLRTTAYYITLPIIVTSIFMICHILIGEETLTSSISVKFGSSDLTVHYVTFCCI